MTFLEKIKPHLISDDLLIQETVLHALHDFPNVPEEWTVTLLKEAFQNKEKQRSIFIYIDKQTINEEAVQILIENIPKMEKLKIHLALRLLVHIEPELALKYREQLENFIPLETWALFELIVYGTEEEVYTEYGKIVSDLEKEEYFQHDSYLKAKKLAKCIVEKQWITEDVIARVIEDELKEQWFSYEGILSIYMIGLLKLEKYIPFLASLLDRDEDILLEETAEALIRFQTDEVVRHVEPYLKRSESVIFAASVVENIKSDLAVQVLRVAYHETETIDDQDILIEALCHQLSKVALPEISEHMEKEYFSNLVDIEQTVYSYYAILGEQHPELEIWEQTALKRDMDHKESMGKGSILQSVSELKETKVGRNDPCTCGSGKKYKKCCGKS